MSEHLDILAANQLTANNLREHLKLLEEREWWLNSFALAADISAFSHQQTKAQNPMIRDTHPAA